jgi:ABC-type uncharacterized transport system permease subunit
MNPRLQPVVSNLVVVVIALGFGAVLIALTGRNPLIGYSYVLFGATATLANLGETLQITTVIVLTGLSFAVAATAGLWNIGTEGQLYLGAIGSMVVAFGTRDFGLYSVILCLLGGALFGAMWGLIPGILKAMYDVDEVVTTILLNFPPVFLTDYLVTGAYRDPTSPVPRSFFIPPNSQLSVLVPGTTIGSGILLVPLAVAIVYVLVSKSTYGFEMRILGGNRAAAKQIGLGIKKITMLSMAMAGALSGLGGSALILGVTHYLSDSLSSGYGFTGIAASALAANNPLFLLVTASFLSVLTVGSYSATAGLALPTSLVGTISAIIIILTTVRNIIGQRLR